MKSRKIWDRYLSWSLVSTMHEIKRNWKILHSGNEPYNGSHYQIASYYFYDNTDFEILDFEEKIYTFSLTLNDETSNFEVFSTLQSITDFSLLTNLPIELVDLIKTYESELREVDKSLFHNIRKQYVVPVEVDFVSETKANQITFLCYTVFGNTIEFLVKAFDYESIRVAFNAIIKKFSELDYVKGIFFKDHIRWIRQKQLKVYQKEKQNYNNSCRLLNGTINNSMTYKKLLFELKNNGYIDNSFREVLKKELTAPQYDNLMKIFDKALLLSVENSKITLLHRSEALNIKEDDDQTVYTLNPRIWQYYINNWYEDFITEAIKVIQSEENFDINIIAIDGNAEYNFKESGKEEDKFELDLLLLLERQGQYKLVAIECKRTMSNRNRKRIREKYENKTLYANSNYKLIDAYINVGYFSNNNDLKIEKIFSNKNNMSNKVPFPFITFASTDFFETISKLKQCFNFIMNNEKDEEYIEEEKEFDTVDVS